MRCRALDSAGEHVVRDLDRARRARLRDGDERAAYVGRGQIAERPAAEDREERGDRFAVGLLCLVTASVETVRKPVLNSIAHGVSTRGTDTLTLLV